MCRVARIIVPGFPHHVTQRGNRRATVRYVALNSVRAGMVERAETYPWSSAAAHCGLRADGTLSTAFPPSGIIGDWAAWLHEPVEDEEAAYAFLQQRTRTGRPCGPAKYLDQLEELLGRALHPKPRGPKPGTKYGRRRQYA